MASPTTLGETTCSALPAYPPCSTYCPWSSTWTTGLEGFGDPSFLESGRANGTVIAPVDYNGLAMQEVPDPSVDFQRTLQQVWATLEQSLASTHTTVSGTLSQQIQAYPTRGQGWKSTRRLGSFLHEDTVGGNHPQFEDQYGDQHCYITNSGGDSQVRRGWSCTTARTGATTSTHNGSGEASRTTSWFAAEYGLSTGRTGAEVTRSGGETCGVRSQTQPWPSQQDGEGREAGVGPFGQDTQARSGLADFCDPGGREVPQAQEHVLGNPSSTGASTSTEDRRACSHQRGDHSCITVPSEQHQSYGGGSVGCRGPGLDGVSTASSRSVGAHGRVPGHGHGRNRDGCDSHRWSTTGSSFSKGWLGDIPNQTGQCTLEGQAGQGPQERWQVGLSLDIPGEDVPVDYVVNDVFEGIWAWNHEVPLQLGIEACGLVSQVCGGDELLCAAPGLGASQREAPVDLDKGISRTVAAHGEYEAAVTPSTLHRRRHERHVRFNPLVEVVEFETDFDFLGVDDVIPGEGCFEGHLECHFTSEIAPGDVVPVENDDGIDPLLDDIGEDEDDPYVILHGFEVLEVSTAGAAISDLEPMKVITYGIRGRSLGRRDTWVTSADLPRLRHAIWELWEDSIPQFAACWAFAVRPQPLQELQVSKAWILIVEIAPGEETPPGYCAALLMTFPKLVREDMAAAVLVPQHPYSQYCIPHGVRVCSLSVEGAIHSTHSDVHVRPGALSKLSLGDAPPSFAAVRHWHPDAEDLVMAASHDQRAGLESFQLVVHAADTEPREFTVDISAFTAPHSLRRILPADVCRGRLHWLPLDMLHPTLGVRPGRYHFVVGSTLPGPSRPVLVLLCFATGAYMERWQHEVRWIPYSMSLAGFLATMLPDLDPAERDGASVSCNQAPISTLHGVSAGSVVVIYIGRSMSSEGLEPPDDEVNLMQVHAQPIVVDATSVAHVVLRHAIPFWSGYDATNDVFQRRTTFLLEHDLPDHVLFSWARPRGRLWRGELEEVDILIQYYRPLGAVDVIVELVDFRHQLRLQNPSVFRILVPLTRWALDWSLQQKYLYAAGSQVGDPCANGIPWLSQGAAQRQFQDGDVITVFLQPGTNINDVCVDLADSTSDDYSGSEETSVELQVVTLFQSGHNGDDQRFDILVPWHEPISATLQWCVANPLVGWAAKCLSFRRLPWQHQRQVFALAWTDLLEAHHVPVLFIETDVGSSSRDRHVEYLPVQMRLEDLLFWAHRTGPFELVDRWRHVHPTLPNVLTFGIGAQVWLRFSAPPPVHYASGVVFLQTAARLKASSANRPYGGWLDPSSIIPDQDHDFDWNSFVVADDVSFPLTALMFTDVEPSLLPQPASDTVWIDYPEDNLDLSSGSNCPSVSADHDENCPFLDPSQVLPRADADDSGSTFTTATDVLVRPSPLPQLSGGTSRSCYTEDNVDLSSGNSECVATFADRSDGISERPSLDPRLASLHAILSALALPWPESSICHDYQAIPALHPVAAMICLDQDWAPLLGAEVRYHIYTDGSALPSHRCKAAWAFHIVMESFGPMGSLFHRIGYTGALVDDRTPEAHSDSMDAEALALIFAADWLLSLSEEVHCVLHFDALAAGCGAFGVQNEPLSTQHVRPLQHLARIALSLAQARHPLLRWHHIKAHAGQPDNEAADSIAYALVMGWQPPCYPPFRLRDLK